MAASGVAHPLADPDHEAGATRPTPNQPTRPARPAHRIPAPRQAAGAEVRRFLGPVEPGFSLGDGWTVDRVYDVHFGGVSLVLRNDDATAVVDMLRKDTETGDAPIASSAYTAFYLANRGDGGEPTPEGAGLAVMSLARVIEEQEHRGARPPALLTLDERIASHSLKNWQLPA